MGLEERAIVNIPHLMAGLDFILLYQGIKFEKVLAVKGPDGEWFFRQERAFKETWVEAKLQILLATYDDSGFSWDSIGSLVMNPLAAATLFAEEVITIEDLTNVLPARVGGPAHYLKIKYSRTDFFVEVLTNHGISEKFDKEVDPTRPYIALADQDGKLLRSSR